MGCIYCNHCERLKDDETGEWQGYCDVKGSYVHHWTLDVWWCDVDSIEHEKLF